MFHSQVKKARQQKLREQVHLLENTLLSNLRGLKPTQANIWNRTFLKYIANTTGSGRGNKTGKTGLFV